MRHQLPHRLSLHAPLGFVLPPLLLGYALADSFRIPAALPLLAAGILTPFCFAALRRAAHAGIWPVLFFAAATPAFWTYGMLTLPAPPPEWTQSLPPRESLVELEMERVFATAPGSGHASGIARVLAAPPHSRLLEGTRLYCGFSDPGPEPVARRGQVLRIRGILRPLPVSGSGGDRSFEDYLRDLGIHYALERGEIVRVLAPPSATLRFYHRMNQRFRDILSLGEPEAGSPGSVYRAMLLGRKADLDPARSASYLNTGTMHLFAISGLHIAVIAGVLAIILQVLRLPSPLRPLLALPLLYAYVQITGASPSALRAFLMAAFFWAAHSFMRQRSPLAALAASAVFVLILSPDQLFGAGFQLSYAVVLSILLLGLPLNHALQERVRIFRDVPEAELRPWERRIADASETLLLLFCVSLSAWLASSPLCASYFGVVSFSGILLNLLLVHLAALVIITGTLSLLLGLLSLEPVSIFINHAAWTLIHLMNLLVDTFAQIPGSSLTGVRFPLACAYAALLLYFLLLIGAHHRGQSHRLRWLLSAPAGLVTVLICGLCFG